ncbi:MAG: 16S rRNA (uracil(1498)-N(3))-methyltransferase [Mucilaginibacter polytrichastri]|nr:16S rRNA (uracil(1498)-N(3))-methyltransferase [Mucilaginibacter polytrichastri]
MHLFYLPDITEQLCLTEEESKHAVRVLRLKEGDRVAVVDGKGAYFIAEISAVKTKRVDLAIVEKQEQFGKRNHRLHMLVAPTKNIDRFEWFVEKATEIGIDEITPVICEHSERKDLRTDRIDRVIISAMKQSVKAYKPQINEPVAFQSVIGSVSADIKAIAHCQENGRKKSIKEILVPGKSVAIMIGPEGDFSPAEIDAALQAGFEPVTLGESRLRTETAALEACFEVNFLNR